MPHLTVLLYIPLPGRIKPWPHAQSPIYGIFFYQSVFPYFGPPTAEVTHRVFMVIHMYISVKVDSLIFMAILYFKLPACQKMSKTDLKRDNVKKKKIC